jgi:predicted RNA-binding Zn-ribbon protein involved in translation (DUF1610 family)
MDRLCLITASAAVQRWTVSRMAKINKEDLKIGVTFTPCKECDRVEVVHGHNIKDHDSAFECSVCGWEDWDTLTADTSKYNYCPNCGAKMDGGNQ